MKRGEIWTAAGGADYAGNPRPVVVVKNDRFPLTRSISTCSFTTNLVESDIFRVQIEPE